MAKSYIKNMKDKLTFITWKLLRQADRLMKVPFCLQLSDSDEPLLCEEVVRIIPGKRLVAFATWGNQEVAVKLFYEKGKAKRDALRDIFGSETLTQANVPTPKLLYKGVADKKKKIHVLIYQKIVDAKSIETLWLEKKNARELLPLLQAVVIELATQHVMGILQIDLHLKNFLVTEKHVYTLDGGKISRFDHPLDKKTSMTYLALFLVQLGVGVSDLQKELFLFYAKSRGWLLKPADIRFFEKMMLQNHKERTRRYSKKIFRTCTAFKKLSRFNRSIMYDRNYESPEFLKLLEKPEQYLQGAVSFLKKGNSATVAQINIDQRQFVMKRYNIKNFFHWCRRAFRPSRAADCWRLSQHLYSAGVATAKPIAFIENRLFGLRFRSYFLMEYIKGPHLGEFYNQTELNETHHSMAGNVIALLNNLTELKMTHGDLKKTNILIENERPVLIDLDGMKEHRSRFKLRAALKKEIERFMRNWQDNPQVYELFNALK